MWREVLSSYAVEDVASVVFRDQHGTWGWLDLWRMNGAPPFSATDLAYLRALTSPVTEALRRGQARSFDQIGPTLERAGPAVLIMSPSLQVKAQTPETEAYLRALIPPGDDERPVPAAAYNVAAQLLAVEAGVDNHHSSARVHLTSGLWMTLRAARVDTADPGLERDIAVTIEPASAAERRAIFTRSHALTPRETAVVDHPRPRCRHKDARSRALRVRAHHPGPPQVDLREDRRSQPAHAAQQNGRRLKPQPACTATANRPAGNRTDPRAKLGNTLLPKRIRIPYLVGMQLPRGSRFDPTASL
jgi:hypothetical protein